MTESARAPIQDLIICGAGPAGAALALLLAEYWPDVARITLIDHRDPAPAADAPRAARLIAISQGSRSTLERLGAWRDAKRSAWKAAAGWCVRLVGALVLTGLAVKLGFGAWLK